VAIAENDVTRGVDEMVVVAVNRAKAALLGRPSDVADPQRAEQLQLPMPACGCRWPQSLAGRRWMPHARNAGIADQARPVDDVEEGRALPEVLGDNRDADTGDMRDQKKRQH
jgi:hypothetical protein